MKLKDLEFELLQKQHCFYEKDHELDNNYRDEDISWTYIHNTLIKEAAKCDYSAGILVYIESIHRQIKNIDRDLSTTITEYLGFDKYDVWDEVIIASQLSKLNVWRNWRRRFYSIYRIEYKYSSKGDVTVVFSKAV